jgi:hypothetical protein
MSNAELKYKLGLMGKLSQAKLSKLAATFLNKAKNKCNKAIDQTSTTCISLFTNFNALKNVDYPSNGSYYVTNESKQRNEDDEFIASLKKADVKSDKNEVKLRSDGSYKLEYGETYNLERIKAEEEILSTEKLDSMSKNSSKYKSVYRSFKTAMKRNSSASSSSSSSLGSSLSSNLNQISKPSKLSSGNNHNSNFKSTSNISSKNSPDNLIDFDAYKNQLPIINWDASFLSQDLTPLKNDYSYDQESACSYFGSSQNVLKKKV